MSISQREQETLDDIEHDLAGSGPELASKLAIFVRLTAGEEMPKRERIGRSYRLSADTAVMASKGSGASEGASASMSAMRASAPG